VREPLPRYRLSRKLIYAGLICLPLIVGAGFVFKPENSTLWIGGPFAIVMALLVAAWLVQKHHDLDALVPAGAAAARIPYDLGGWEPKTAAQLRAVVTSVTRATVTPTFSSGHTAVSTSR
jgi:hypothetical protein